jgi:hypothetical protein
MTNAQNPTETLHSYTADGRVITAAMRAQQAVIPMPTLEERKAEMIRMIREGRSF